MDNINGIIYIIKNKINESIYIGSTKKSLYNRWNEHKSAYKTGKMSKLYNEMRNLGIENFYIEILEQKKYNNIDDLRKRENELIISYNSIANGYNIIKSYNMNREMIINNNNDIKEVYDKINILKNELISLEKELKNKIDKEKYRYKEKKNNLEYNKKKIKIKNKLIDKKIFEDYLENINNEDKQQMKVCNRCKIKKKIDKFNVDNKKKDGLNIYCKNCLKEMKAEKKITEEILEKKCKCCLEIKMINEFNVDKGKKDNYNIYCKKCVKEKNDKSISKNKIKNIIEKKCIKCNETKNVSEFHINKQSKDGFCVYCKLCNIKYKYNKENNDEKKECAKCKIEKNISLFVKDKEICQVCIYLEKQERKKLMKII
jgi:hypothetical protein